MNHILQKFARQYLKDNLNKLPGDWQKKFKLMYARNNGKRSVEDSLLIDINEVVDKIPEDKLDWAMIQIENSLKKFWEKGISLHEYESSLKE